MTPLGGDLSDSSYMDEGFYIPERYYWSTGLESGLASTLRRGKEPQMIQGVLSAIKREGIEGHPNRQPFRGLLTWIDLPSDSGPSGAKGHRVILSRLAAENAVHTLLGMGVSHHLSGSSHDAKRKVGIVTHAEVIEKRLEIGGYLFARDFPEVVEAVRGGRAGDMGFSYEMTNVAVEDIRGKTWKVLDCTFTGAALIRKDRAAYRNTWIELL